MWKLRLALASFVLTVTSALAAANYVYIIDTSDSMRQFRTSATTRVTLDIERAFDSKPPLFEKGDRIELWTFDSEVRVLLEADYKPDTAETVRSKIKSELTRLGKKKWSGVTTTLAVPLRRAMEHFLPSDSGSVNLFLYTDGRDSISIVGSEPIYSIYVNFLKQRLSHLVLIRFGDHKIPDSTVAVLGILGGEIVNAGDAGGLPDRQPSHPVVVAQKPTIISQRPPIISVQPTIISVQPTNIHFTALAAAEIVKPVPLEFRVDPPQSGSSVQVAVETSGWPTNATISTASDRLITEGRQSISFIIKNAQPGRYSAKLKFSSPNEIRPREIPVEIEIRPSTPDNIAIQFYPQKPVRVELAGDGQWHSIPNFVVSLFYPSTLATTPARFSAEISSGVEVRLLPNGEVVRSLAPAQVAKLSDLGGVVGAQVRLSSPAALGKPLSLRLILQIDAHENVRIDGTNAMTVPFEFVSQKSVRLETSEIDLGTIAAGANRVTRSVKLQATANCEGRKLRVLTKGAGLGGLVINPSEIALKGGAQPVEMEFSGFERRPAGPLEGSLVFLTDDSDLKLESNSVGVRGKISEPAKLLVEVENSMVVGQPLVIHARLDSGESGAFRATVRPVGANRSSDLILLDTGDAEIGDTQANDRIYSGIFKETDQVGRYEIDVSSVATNGVGQRTSVVAPIYFQPPSLPLIGKLAHRKQGAFIEFKAQVRSEFPRGIAVRADATDAAIPFTTFVPDKRLEPGNNSIDLLVRPIAEAKPGQYKFQLDLVTDAIEGKSVRIPVVFQIRVLSLFQRFLWLVALALLIAVCAFVAIMSPWQRWDWLKRRRRTTSRATRRLDALSQAVSEHEETSSRSEF